MRRVFDKTLKSDLFPDQIGDYELIALTIESPKIFSGDETAPFLQKKISLDFIFENFSIYEDLYSNCLSGTITLIDGNNLLTDFPFIGEETLYVVFRSMNTAIAIELKFRVTSISNIEKINEETKIYTLHLISEVALRNQKQKISMSFPKSKLSHVVAYLCEKKLGLVNEQTVKTTDSGGYLSKNKDVNNNYYSIETTTPYIEKYIAPSLSPFRVINKLCKRNLSPSGSLFFFFQDINRFRFVSLEDIFKNKPKNDDYVKKLYYIPKDSQDKSQEFEFSWNIVYDYKVVKRFDVLQNMSRGMYSSEVSYVDIEKRKFETKSYYYQDEASKQHHINNDGYLLTTRNSDVLHDPKNEAPATINELVMFHSGDPESQDYSDHRKEMYQRRMSMQAQLDALVVQVELAGDSSGRLSVGDLVHFHVPRHQDTEGDLYLSGKYMVTRIHHNVSLDSKYRILVEMVTDSISTNYRFDIANKKKSNEIGIKVNSKDLDLEREQDIVRTSILSSEIINDYNLATRLRKLEVQLINSTNKNV